MVAPAGSPETPPADAGATRSISVVIPCLNEASSIASCVDTALKTIAELGVEGEVIVADNGSSDGSEEIARANGARVVPVASPGYGAAVRGGIAAARGSLLMLGDGDGQHDFSEIGLFVSKIDEGYDLVVGNRFARPIGRGAMKWTHRYIGNPLLSGLLRTLFRSRAHDAQCGMRALTRVAYDQIDLRTSGFELCPEMVIKAARARLRVGEVPITTSPELHDRPSHLKTVPDGWRHLVFLLMSAPNVLFVAPGAAVMAAGVGIVSWLFAGPQRIGHVPLDTRTELFGVLLAAIGFQIMSIGMFARVFSYTEPRRFRARAADRFLKTISLEQGLAFGAALVAVGLAGGIYDYVGWAQKGFGIFGDDRSIIFWALWFVLGVQICYSSLFLSMIGVSRRVWIGDAS